MMRAHSIWLGAATLACGAAAHAQIDPTDSGIRTIESGETASVALKAFSRSDSEIIHGSDGNIAVDQAFEIIGPLLGGPDVIEARWSEIRGFGTNVLQFEFQSRDGSAFVPADYQIGGEQAEFLGWEIGALDPIEFRDFTGEITVTDYRVFVSENGGIDFTVFDLTSSFQNPWDGVDIDRTIPLRTPGGPVEYNFMLVEYTYEYTVPAPATFSIVAAAGLAGMRRRR